MSFFSFLIFESLDLDPKVVSASLLVGNTGDGAIFVSGFSDAFWLLLTWGLGVIGIGFGFEVTGAELGTNWVIAIGIIWPFRIMKNGDEFEVTFEFEVEVVAEWKCFIFIAAKKNIRVYYLLLKVVDYQVALLLE